MGLCGLRFVAFNDWCYEPGGEGLIDQDMVPCILDEPLYLVAVMSHLSGYWRVFAPATSVLRASDCNMVSGGNQLFGHLKQLSNGLGEPQQLACPFV